MNMNYQVSQKNLELLEKAALENEKNLSNYGLCTHWIKGKGEFQFRVVCEFIPEAQSKGQEKA